MAEQPALSFAGLLRRLRAEAQMTQEELAEAAGLSPRSVSDLERGIHRTAHKDTAVLLAGAEPGRTGARAVPIGSPRAGTSRRRAGRRIRKATGGVGGGGPGAAEQSARPAGDVYRPGPGAVRGPGPSGILPSGHLDRRRRVRQDQAGHAGGRRAARRIRRRGLASGAGRGQQQGRRGACNLSGAGDHRAAGPGGPGHLAGCPGPSGHADRAGQLRAPDRRLRQDRRRHRAALPAGTPADHQPRAARHRRRDHLPGAAAVAPRARRYRLAGGRVLRGSRAVHRPGQGAGHRPDARRADRPAGGVDLRAAGRAAAGYRAGRGPAALAIAQRPARPPRPAVPPAHRGKPHRPGAAADPAGDRSTGPTRCSTAPSNSCCSACRCSPRPSIWTPPKQSAA